MLNQVTICGRLGRDPEVRQAGGSSVTNFTLAVSEKYKDKKTGETKENTYWIKCHAWGMTGEIAAEASKGDELIVSGKLQTQKWKDKDGNKRETTLVYANSVHKTAQRSDSSESKSKAKEKSTQRDAFDDDIPF